MGADVRFYLEKYNSKEKKWEYAGAYTDEGKITSLLITRAHNYMDLIENDCLTDPINHAEDMSEQVFEKFRDHFDPTREEYDGIYATGAVQLSELDRACLSKPEVDDDWADDDEWIEEEDGTITPPKKPNPLRHLYRFAYDVAEMMGYWCFDDRTVRLVYICDN